MIAISDIAKPHSQSSDMELQEIMRQIPSEVPNETVALPQNPTLHDISQAYVDAYCKCVSKRPPKLMRDRWDNGITTPSMEDIFQEVSTDDLQNLSTSRQKLALKILNNWVDNLYEKRMALKTTDGCNCFGRHANSEAIESHLELVLRDVQALHSKLFLQAAANADLAALKEWIASGMDVNASDRDGRTALIALLENTAQCDEDRRKIDECANFLLSVRGIDVEKCCSRPGSPRNAFELAIQHGHESTARHLLNTHPDITFHNSDKGTIVYCTAQRCPGFLKDLQKKFLGEDGTIILAAYREEISYVPSKDRKPIHTFFIDVITGITQTKNFAEGCRTMDAFMTTARIFNDLGFLVEVRAATAREMERLGVGGMSSSERIEKLGGAETIRAGEDRGIPADLLVDVVPSLRPYHHA